MILGKNDKIPLIISYRNILGVSFYTSKEYPESIHFIFSFTENSLNLSLAKKQVQNILFKRPYMMDKLGPPKNTIFKSLDSRARPRFPKEISFVERSQNLLKILRERINFYIDDTVPDDRDINVNYIRTKKPKIKVVNKRYLSVSQSECNLKPIVQTVAKDGKQKRWLQYTRDTKNRSFTRIRSLHPINKTKRKLNLTFSHF